MEEFNRQRNAEIPSKGQAEADLETIRAGMAEREAEAAEAGPWQESASQRVIRLEALRRDQERLKSEYNNMEVRKEILKSPI